MDIRSWQLFQEQRERIVPRLASNDTWEDVEAVIDWAMTYRPLDTPILSLAGRPHVIIWGETDGFGGLPEVCKRMQEAPESTLIISGGVYGREETTGEIGAIDLYRRYHEEMEKLGWSNEDIKRRVIIDSWSLHTGDQRIVLSAILSELGAPRVSIVLPLYHMPRFILTINEGLKRLGVQLEIYPSPFGTRTTPHIAKRHINKSETFTYEELFALPPTRSRGADEVKSFDCGEIDKILEYQQLRNKQCLTFREALDLFKIKN